MKILITGHSGVLGTRVREYIGSIRPDIIQLKLKSNLLDFDSVLSEIKNVEKIDMVMHLASVVAVKDVEEQKELATAVNVTGTKNLLEAIRLTSQSPYIYFSSSSHVYGTSKDYFSELDVCNPINHYGQTKLRAEEVCDYYSTNYGQKICIGRIFSMWDSLQVPPFLYPNLKRRLALEDLEKPFLLNGANSIRDLLPAKEIARISTELLISSFTGKINIASGYSIKISDFARSISTKSLNIIHQGTEDQISADVTKLTKLINIKNKYGSEK